MSELRSYEDVVPVPERIATALEGIWGIHIRQEREREKAKKNAHKGQLYGGSFEISDMVHISFVDDNDNTHFYRSIPPNAEFRIPHRKASSLHITNQSTTSEKIKMQSNIGLESMDAIIELEPDEAIELDGHGYLDEPILESINIMVSSGTTARVRVVIRA